MTQDDAVTQNGEQDDSITQNGEHDDAVTQNVEQNDAVTQNNSFYRHKLPFSTWEHTPSQNHCILSGIMYDGQIQEGSYDIFPLLVQFVVV